MSAKSSLDSAALRKCLDTAVVAAQEAGNLMLECFMKNDAQNFIEEKANPADLVTKYDRQVEELVLARLKSAYPGFSVIAEETEHGTLTDAPTWIVDPIDGTTNFIHKQPECCVLIGLAVGKKSVLGVCYIPKLDEMYTAIHGCGAYCNGRPIRTSGCEDLKTAMINDHMPSYTRGPKIVDRILCINRDLLAHPVRAIRSGGSAGVDMMHVAKGRLDAYFEVGVYAWDVCAGAVIVEEAGGACVDTLGGAFDLGSRRVMVAASAALAEQLAVYMKKHRYSSLGAEDYEPPDDWLPDAKRRKEMA